MADTKKYSEYTQQIIDSVNCPYEVFAADKTVEDVTDAYFEALEEGKEKGFTPILVVTSDTLAETLKYNSEDGDSPEKLIKKDRLDAKEVFKEYIEANEADLDDDMLLGDKDYGEEIDEFSSFCLTSDGYIDETILFKIPTKNPWEVIAWVPMGGWNECPDAEDMMAISKYWYEKYGAIPAVVSSDTLEYIVDKPVDDEDEAWELAKEHYLFCSDRVFQGTETETIGEIADCLSQSTVWFFWWD